VLFGTKYVAPVGSPPGGIWPGGTVESNETLQFGSTRTAPLLAPYWPAPVFKAAMFIACAVAQANKQPMIAAVLRKAGNSLTCLIRLVCILTLISYRFQVLLRGAVLLTERLNVELPPEGRDCQQTHAQQSNCGAAVGNAPATSSLVKLYA